MPREREIDCVCVSLTNHSLDEHTGAIIDEVLKSWFVSWTIIAIVHKLESIRDFDMVAVLDKGRLIEFDEPEALLARESMFKELYQMQRGTTSAEATEKS